MRDDGSQGYRTLYRLQFTEHSLVHLHHRGWISLANHDAAAHCNVCTASRASIICADVLGFLHSL